MLGTRRTEPAPEDSRAKKRGKHRSRRVSVQKRQTWATPGREHAGARGAPFPGPLGAPPPRVRPEPAAPAPRSAALGVAGFCLYWGSLANGVWRVCHRRALSFCTRVRLPGRRGEVARPPASPRAPAPLLLLLPGSRRALYLALAPGGHGRSPLPPSRSRLASPSPGDCNYLFIYGP